MRSAWLLACITIQVCTTTRAEDLPVELVAPVPEGKCMHNTHSRSLPGTGMHGRGPPCMPPGPRKASLILLSPYSHLTDWPANRTVAVYRLNASSDYWVMSPGMHGRSPPRQPLGSLASLLILCAMEVQPALRHAERYPEVRHAFRCSNMPLGDALRESKAPCRPLCPLNYIVPAPACPGQVLISTIPPSDTQGSGDVRTATTAPGGPGQHQPRADQQNGQHPIRQPAAG